MNQNRPYEVLFLSDKMHSKQVDKKTNLFLFLAKTVVTAGLEKWTFLESE